MISTDELAAALAGYCAWASLPQRTLAAAVATWSKQHGAADDGSNEGALLAAFLRCLACGVPLEWTVSRHAACPAGAGACPAMHARAAGTRHGLFACGGLQLGALTELQVTSEVSWMKEHQPHMLQPDFSRVFQASAAHQSRQAVAVAPAGDGSWAGKLLSPQLPAGLMGHSVAMFGSRAIIFGGLLENAAAAAADAAAQGASKPPPARRTCNVLRAYAVDASGTQGGLLPVLTDPLPQLGPLPSSRAYHAAAVDADGGAMYVYGGIHIRERDGARLPADGEPGVLHCYSFHSYTWQTLATTGATPRSTTLLALFWHKGALWAVPDLPAPPNTISSSGGGSSSCKRRRAPPCYQLLRLDMASCMWEEVVTAGEPPCQRTDACSVLHNSHLVVYGGRTAAPPASMLCDLHVLDLESQPPAWQAVQPRLLQDASSSCCAAGSGNTSSSSSSSGGQGGMLPLAGHTGGSSAAGGGCVVFYGGYRRADVKQPQQLLQVLQVGVRPPTPDAAQLRGAAASSMAFALQHVRLQLARLVRQHHPRQVLLKPDGHGGVRLPALLLALHSCLFDDLFQQMLQRDEDEQDGSSEEAQPMQVPVPGASLEGVASVCRWMMGLLALGSCDPVLLVEVYRVADRLIMERLMVEVLELLAAGSGDMAPQHAAAVLQLSTDLSGGGAGLTQLGAAAEQQLRQQVTPLTAPSIMAIAISLNHQELQERCIQVMQAQRKNVWPTLEFACRFGLARLQGSCLAQLRRASHDRLVDSAARVVKVASRHAQQQQQQQQQQQHKPLPVVQMLEADLLQELLGAGLDSLLAYAAAAEQLQLTRLRQGIVDACGSADGWQQLQQHAQVVQQLRQRFPDLLAAIQQRLLGQGGEEWQGTRLPLSTVPTSTA